MPQTTGVTSLGEETVTFHRQATQEGTSAVQLSVYYETQRGCVGQSPTFSFRSMASPEYAVAVGAGFCAGDCDGDGEVTIDELISMVNIGFEPALIDDCDAGDDDGDGAIRIEELVLAVSNSLLGCNRGTLLPDLVALGVFPSEFVSPPYLPPQTGCA
jgi:hypothetical protein